MNTDLLTRVQQLDPTAPGDITPDGVWSSAQVLEEVQRRATKPALSTGPTGRRRLLVFVGAAAAVLLVIGGLAVLSRTTGTDAPPVVDQREPEQPESVDPPTSAVPLPRLTEDIPLGLESGTIDTPRGTARWVRVPRDQYRLPPAHWGTQTVPWPSGFGILQSLNDGRAQFWVSVDGIEWNDEPLPVSAAEDASLTLVEGVYWLVSSNPGGLWSSTDGVTWDEYDASALAAPGPAGFRWTESRLSTPVTVGDVTLLLADYTGNFPYEIAGSPTSGCERLHEVGPGVFVMVADEGPCIYRELRIVEVEVGLLVSDAETGEELGLIEGADLTHIAQSTWFDEIHNQRLLHVGNAGITSIEVPWPGFNSVTLFGVDDAAYAYVIRHTANDENLPTSVWRSTDGETWTDLGPPSFLRDMPETISWHSMDFTVLADSLAVIVRGGSESEFGRDVDFEAAWETTDGVTWTPIPAGLPDGTRHLVRMASGWFANDGDIGGHSDGDVWWMLVNGTWVSLADLGMEVPDPSATERSRCTVHPTATEATTFFFASGCPDDSLSLPAYLWVLDLDPSG
jgi:hypothetical protein